MKNLSQDILKTKQHFEILDGLRGVAAVAIVCFHFMEIAYSDFTKNFIAHGFLAVDFFFCLSGFVIAYAYDDRMTKMGVIEFFKSRLIRLHPLVVLGSVLGLLAFLYDPFGGQSAAYNAGQVALIFLASVFLIPYPVITERFFNNFGLNAPAWSLFWEYVANIIYAFVLYRLSRPYLFSLLIISAILLFKVSYDSGNLLGGWAGENFWDGGARILYSFTAGMFIYRSNWIIKNRLGFAGLSILLLLAFLMPFNPDYNWITQPLVVILYFPLIVSLGAGSILSPGLKKLCVFSGNISYPLYMTHYAVIWSFFNYYTASKPGTPELVAIIISGMIILVLFAYIIMIAYDIPVRKYLTRKRKQLSQ